MTNFTPAIDDNFTTPLHFYHGDHLGSAAYLTDRDGHVVQTLAYLPYGEDWVEQNSLADTTRLGMYRYNGKEKDGESGYLYYGARYYWSELWNGWLSVDPMADKYPSLSPYNYCAWNPMKLVDPDGEFPILPTVIAYYGIANVMEYSGGSRNIKQAGFAMKRPITALSVGSLNSPFMNISRTSSNFEKNIARASDMTTGDVGDYGNALRHTLWQALITNKYGVNVAERIGNAHEDYKINPCQRRFSNKDEADAVVDYLNNQIGRRIGNCGKISNTKIASKVLLEFFQYGLWTIDKQGDNKFIIRKTKLSEEQFKNAQKELLRLRNNGYEK